MRSRSRTMAMLATCALAQACVADRGGEEAVESATEALEIAPQSPILCDYRIYAEAGDGVLGFPYCATADLASAREFAGVRTLVISQHGRGSDAGSYLDVMEGAIHLADQRDGLVSEAETFVIAPQFIQPSKIPAPGIPDATLDMLFVWDGGDPLLYDWATGGRSYRTGAPGSRSSFDLLEQLVGMAIARMPDLEQIIFVGQSAGGIFTQRYALLNDYDFPPDVHVRYVPANSWGWVYPSDERPIVSGAGFAPPDFDAYPGTQLYPDPQVCPVTGDYAICSDYDDYWRGLRHIPVAHWASQHLPLVYDGGVNADPDHIDNVDVDAVAATYASRDVVYLASEADIIHAEQCPCGDQLQGEHVRSRAQIISAYMKSELGASSHDVVVVPDVGHGGGVLDEPCARAAIFGSPSLCVAMPEHTVGTGWTGSIVSIAYGNVDDDDAEEMAVVENQGLISRVVVLDDRDHRHRVLYEPSYEWTYWQRPQSVAFGDLNGDGRDELAVARSASSEDTWLVYRRLDGGSWITIARGGADWAAPRTAGHVAFGDVDGDGNDELAVTRVATSGTRWFVYQAAIGDIGDPVPTSVIASSGSAWADGVRPTDIALGDVDGDGNDELAVSRDAGSGARMYVYQLDASPMIASAIGTGWRTGHVVRQIDVGDADGDGKAEIVLGRDVYPGYSRWVVLDDATAAFAVLHEGGRNSSAGWPSDATVSALAFGTIARWGAYPVLAVAATSASGPLLELAAFQELGSDPTFVVGDYERPPVPLASAIRSLAFGDADGLGGEEIAYGIANPSEAGYGVRVLPAP